MIALKDNSAADNDKPFALGAAIRATKSGDLAVVSVVADGPCARAGVRKGDVVKGVEGVKVHSLDEIAGRLRLFADMPCISVTIRSARAGREADVLLHRPKATDKRSTSDVAEALRRIASSAGQSSCMTKGSTDPQHRELAKVRQNEPAASRSTLQDISNGFVSSGAGAKHGDDNESWIVSFAPGGSSENTTYTRQKSPGKKHSKAAGSPANKGLKSGASPKKSSAPRVRFSPASSQRVFAEPSPSPRAGSLGTAPAIPSPSSPPPPYHESLHTRQQGKETDEKSASPALAGGTGQADSPLPEISGGSMLLQHSLSISPSSVGRSQVRNISTSWHPRACRP